jgi:hypothetical protein
MQRSRAYHRRVCEQLRSSAIYFSGFGTCLLLEILNNVLRILHFRLDLPLSRCTRQRPVLNLEESLVQNNQQRGKAFGCFHLFFPKLWCPPQSSPFPVLFIPRCLGASSLSFNCCGALIIPSESTITLCLSPKKPSAGSPSPSARLFALRSPSRAMMHPLKSSGEIDKYL